MEERKQFTFYLSIFKAIRKIKKKTDRADAYDAICAYALFGEEPDLEAMTDSVSIAFELIRPVLDSSRRKSKSGKQGGSKPKQTESKPEAKDKQTESKPEESASKGEKEKEEEIEKEVEIEHECVKRGCAESKPQAEGRSFTGFWEDYPAKINREEAWETWKGINPDAQTVGRIKAGLEAWKRSPQWTEDGGRYIPSAAKWLKDRRWEVLPPAGKQKVPMGASGTLGAAELEAIQRVLREG